MGGSRVMNEANTSNNRAVMESPNSSANSLQPEQTICPFYTVVPSENTTNAKLPLLNPAEDEQDEIPTADSPQDEKQQDWVGEPDGEKQAQVETDFRSYWH